MTSRYTPVKRSIGEMLSTISPPLVVPEWQRNYRWNVSQASVFWEDLRRFDDEYPGENITDQEYFLGSVVIVEAGGRRQLVLDGQQRLATAAVLLSVIRDFLERYSHDAAERLATRYLRDFDDANNVTTYKITLNRYDREFFQREVLDSRGEVYNEPTPRLESHKLISFCRKTPQSARHCCGLGHVRD